MRVKDLIKDIENNKNKYKEIIKMIKPDSTDNARGCESFLMFVLLYPLCKNDKNKFCELVGFEKSNDFTYAANVGEYIFKRIKIDSKDTKNTQYPGYQERKNAWDEYEKRYDQVDEAWKKLNDEQKEEWKKVIVERIYKGDKEKEKNKIIEFKTKILFKDKEIPQNVTRTTLEECITGNKKAIKDLMYLRNTIWNEKALFITTNRIQYKDMLDYYDNYCIKHILGDKYTSKNDKSLEEYSNLECNELIKNLCEGILSSQSKITEEIRNAYNNNFLEKRESNMRKINIVEQELNKILIEGNKQIIFTGAPGTGKTYNVLHYVKEYTKSKERYKFIQFHASYDYSDFVEGLRPVVIEGQENNSFVRLDGVFKEFCRKIVENNSKQSLNLQENAITQVDIHTDCEEIESQEIKSTDDKDDKIYYFIIDEINRADLSKVFGELMFGLEESYRGVENRFDTQYKNLPTYKINENGKAVLIENDCFKNGFYIPKNLVIIGTMNDIDRSVETFDFALRRRFRWIEIKANDVMESALVDMRDGDGKEIAESAIKMNNVINKYNDLGLNESFNIGPAYFKSGDKQDIWNTKVQPILFEYCRGRRSERVNEFIDECKEAFLG